MITIKSKIKKILVPLDGSKNSLRGLDEAIYLARQCQATITGMYVLPLPKPEKSNQISAIEKRLLETAADFMLKSKIKCAQNGILFEDKIVYGNEGEKIVSFATKNKFDLIVIGSRGLSGLREFFLGSTSHHVVHKATMPVLIIK